MKPAYSTNNPQNIVATGRFTFTKKNLYYSFYISDKAIRPRSVQFINSVGMIIEEHNLETPFNGPLNLYQNKTGKICGVWRRVPKEYRKLLREERMSVVLLWGGNYQAELALAGRIARYTALSTELFSSLLEPASDTKPDQMSGAGGTAIVSTSNGVTSSIHLTLVFTGLFVPDEIMDALINIRIESLERKQIILEDTQRIKDPDPYVNVLEISSPVSTHDLRLLSRGKLVLTIESRKNPALKIQGHIVTRVVCELFQTLLTPSNIGSNTTTSGLAWMYLNREGSLIYNIQTDELSLQKNPTIKLVDDGTKRRATLEDLTPSFNFNQAIGSIDKLSPRVLEPLYNEELAINIATDDEPNLVRGRLIARPVADARDSIEPILLKRMENNTPAHLMGMAWIAIDNECNLHYEVTISALFGIQQTFSIYLEEKPIEAPGAPVTRQLLRDFNGSYVEDFTMEIPSAELAKLETSVCYLEIESKDANKILLRGKLKSTKVPNHCFPHYTDNNVPSVVSALEQNDNTLLPPDSKCYHSGRFYDEGEQWKSSMVPCTVCSCQHGRVNCDSIKCPEIKCKPNEERVMNKGECCNMCKPIKTVNESSNSAQRGCYLGEQFHMAGASWHPYLPPNGFDTCTTCTCDYTTLDTNCIRMECPPLTCSERVAYRPNKKACCKVCPEAKPHVVEKDVMQDERSRTPTTKTSDEVLANGGCKVVNTVYENGQEWHPIVASHGEQKCVKCRCKVSLNENCPHIVAHTHCDCCFHLLIVSSLHFQDSQISCDRKRCTRSVCNSRIAAKRKGLPVSEGSECCTSSQCKRTRRHQNSRRMHRDRDEKQQSQSLTKAIRS